MLPLHSGKPQRSRSLLTSLAKARKRLRSSSNRILVGGDEDDAVILVGAEGLLVAAFRAKGQPGPFDAREIVVVEGELDDAAGQRVVERRDELRQLLGADALCQHVERELADVGGRLFQRRDVLRGLDRLADLAQRDTLQREQVALGDDAGQAAFGIGHRHVPDAVGRHRQHCIVGSRVLLEDQRLARHGLADRRRQRQIGEDDAVEQVVAGEHADRLPVLAGDHQRADAGLGHGFQRCPHRRRRCHEDRIARADAGERRIERLLLAGALGELLLQLLAGLLQQAGHVLGAEQVELAAGFHQRHEVRRRELVAEGVLEGRIHVGRRPAGSHRADRETLAGTKRKDRILGHRDLAGLARLDLAPLDQAEEAHDTRIGADDFASRRVEGKFRLVREVLQRLGRHLVERLMLLEEFLGIAGNTPASLFP